MTMHLIIICEECGKEAPAARASKKYCGNTCITRASKRRQGVFCSIDLCDRIEFGRGYCNAHYTRWSRYGDPLLGRKAPNLNFKKYFSAGDWDNLFLEIKKSTVLGENGCWDWQGSITNTGYGMQNVGVGKQVLIHRLMMITTRQGADPLGDTVHHICANRSCVNPAHLQLISQADNNAEMLERKYYKARIAQLEAALAKYAPEHPLLFIPERATIINEASSIAGM